MTEQDKRTVCEFLGITPEFYLVDGCFNPTRELALEQSIGSQEPIEPRYPDILTGDGMLLVMEALDRYSIRWDKTHNKTHFAKARIGLYEAGHSGDTPAIALALAVLELARRGK